VEEASEKITIDKLENDLRESEVEIINARSDWHTVKLEVEKRDSIIAMMEINIEKVVNQKVSIQQNV